MAVKHNTIKNRAGSAKSSLWWLTVICIIFGQLLVYAWIRTRSTHDMIQISQAQAALTKAHSYNKALLLEIERLNAEDRIIRIAQSRLDLSRDTGIGTLYLSKGEN